MLSLFSSESKVPKATVPSLETKGALTSRSRGVKARPKFSRGKSGRPSQNPDLPPSMNVVPTVSNRYRFLSSNAGTFTITGNMLSGALGAIVYVANTTARAWTGSVRIHSLTAWPPASGTVDLAWGNPGSTGFEKDEGFVKVLPTGITETGGLMFRPPAKSLSSSWFLPQSLGASNVFVISCGSGTVLDLHVSFTLGANQTGATIAITSGAVGVTGYTALDGTASNKLLPQGLPPLT